MFFQGPALQNPLNFDDFQPALNFENRSKFLSRFLLDFVEFGFSFGLILEPILHTFGALGCLGVGLGGLWAAIVVNFGVLGATWSPWGRMLVDVGFFLLHFGTKSTSNTI